MKLSKAKSNGRIYQLKATRTYLLGISIFAFGLFALNMISLWRERNAATALSISDQRYNADRFLNEVESGILSTTDDIVDDADVRRICQGLAKEDAPEKIRELRTELEKVRARYPMVRTFFVAQNGRVKFPRLQKLPPHRPVLDAEAVTAEQKQFAALFGRAEAAAAGGPGDSLDLFLQCTKLPVPDDWKAMALYRVARTHVARGEPTDASRQFGNLEDRYGDLYDAQNRPYAIVATFERAQIAGSNAVLKKHLEELYCDLMTGRWECTPDQVNSLTGEFKKYLNFVNDLKCGPSNGYDFDMARVIEKKFDFDVKSESGKARYQAIENGGRSYQTFSIKLPQEGGKPVLLGFLVDMDWVAGPLFAKCAHDLALPLGWVGGVKLVPIPKPEAVADSKVLQVPFRTVLTTYQLNMDFTGAQTVRTAIDGGFLLALVCLLALVSVLFFKVYRELKLIQLRSDFLSGVSHELKTPLTLISLYAETLMCDDTLPADERRNCYGIIGREAERLHHLIRNLLHLSKIERAKEDYKLVEGDIAPAVAKTVRVCEQWFGQRGFSITLHVAKPLPKVRFDGEKVAQALMNLMDNARKYSGESKLIEVSIWGEGSCVLVDVQDHGIGVPPGESDDIFQQFYRGSNAGAQGGSGLGLFLVHRIMEAHGGSIEVESEVGLGSRFRLIFPACSPAAPGAKNPMQLPIFEE
jgi:signal transduction histidine kinase